MVISDDGEIRAVERKQRVENESVVHSWVVCVSFFLKASPSGATGPIPVYETGKEIAN